MRKVLFASAVVALVAASGCWAQSLDPPLWTVVGTGTANQFSGQNFLLANEVNKLGATSEVGLYIQGGSPKVTDFNPFYLILGFVNEDLTFSVPTITGVTVYNNAGTPNGSGILNAGAPNSVNSGLSIAGDAVGTPKVWQTNNSGDDVYSFLSAGFSGAPNSENWGNWVAAEAALTPPITANKFLLAVYDVSAYSNTATFAGQGLLDFTLSSTLPVGTFAIGFSCGPTDCSSNPNPFANPFTQSGITTDGPTGDVPEPAAIVLLGTITCMVTLALRKKTARS